MALEPKKMKVGEMREALEARGLDTSGLKNDLIHRLEMALDEEEFGVSEAPATGETGVAVVAAQPFVVAEETATGETPPAAPAVEAPEAAKPPEVPAAVPVDMSDLAKKKAERAARFGIPVTQPAAVAEKPKGGQEKKNEGKKSEGKQRGGKMSEEVSFKKLRGCAVSRLA